MRLFFVLLVACCWSCGSSHYQVVTDASVHEREEGELKKIIYLDTTFATRELRAAISEDLKDRSLDDMLERIPMLSRTEQIFAQATLNVLQENYGTAYALLNHLEDPDYGCQVQLLKADCLYQMRKLSLAEAQSQYQAAMDCSQSPRVRSNIRTWYKFLRYGL